MTAPAAGLDTPAELVAAARTVLDRPDALPGPAWARSTALLARQALEAALAEFWRREVPDEVTGSFTTQLLCLRSYVPTEVATGAFEAWAALSTACHHHAYDLAPTAAELHNWVDAVATLVTALGPGAPPPPAAGAGGGEQAGGDGAPTDVGPA